MHSNELGGRVGKLVPEAVPVESPQAGSVVVERETFYEIISIEGDIMRWKTIADGQVLDEEIPLEELQSDEISVYAAKDITLTHPFGDLCNALKESQVTSLNLSELPPRP